MFLDEPFRQGGVAEGCTPSYISTRMRRGVPGPPGNTEELQSARRVRGRRMLDH